MTPTDLAQFNPFDADTLQCPYPHYAAMREQAPVLLLEQLGLYLVTRHDLVLSILRDPKTFSSKFGRPTMPLSEEDAAKVAEAVADGYPRASTMLTTDPPDQTRYRGLVAKAFNPRTIAAMEPFIRSIVTKLIDSWGDRTDIEFVADFAVPVPVHVIATMLNQPEERFADIKRWSDASIAGIGTNISVEGRVAAERCTNEFQRYFASELERRRTEPQYDLLTNLLNATIDEPGVDPRPLDMPEALSIISQLMVAGNETTTKLLTEMMRLLGEHPEQWQRVQADPSRIERIVEESLRLSSPTQGMFRVATDDVELAGVSVPKGARLVIVYGAANRDEIVYPEAESFDPDRDRLKEHLAFGKGIHFCLGAALSRLEAKVALDELTKRVGSYRLADSNDYAYYPSFMLRGLQRLDIELAAPAAPGPAHHA
ncbi:MAG: cytochrome P450 [Actinomycetota bacterium]|nr:cytochrome P450 [Actinomycetota bacterium]